MPVSIWMAAPPLHPERRQNTSHSASSLRSPITGGSRVRRKRRRSSGRSRRARRSRPRRSGRAQRGLHRAWRRRTSCSRPCERARDRLDAAAIGVGLDHGGAFRRHRGLLELPPVGDDGVEVDGEDAGGARQRRGLLASGERRVLRAGALVSATWDQRRCSCRFYARHTAAVQPRAARQYCFGPAMAVMGEIAEAGELALELQFDGAGRAVALLADDDFGLAVHQRHVELPFLVFGRADPRLLVLRGSIPRGTRRSRRRRPARSSRIHAGPTVAGACRRGFRPDARAATAR